MVAGNSGFAGTFFSGNPFLRLRPIFCAFYLTQANLSTVEEFASLRLTHSVIFYAIGHPFSFPQVPAV